MAPRWTTSPMGESKHDTSPETCVIYAFAEPACCAASWPFTPNEPLVQTCANCLHDTCQILDELSELHCMDLWILEAFIGRSSISEGGMTCSRQDPLDPWSYQYPNFDQLSALHSSFMTIMTRLWKFWTSDDSSSDATVDVNWDRHPKDVKNTCQTTKSSDAITSAMARPCLFEIQGISGHGFLDQWHSLPRRHLSRATASGS